MPTYEARTAASADLSELKDRLRKWLPSSEFAAAEKMLDALGERAAKADDDDPDLGARRDLGPRDANDALAMDAAPSSAAGQRALRQAVARCSPILGEDAALAFDSAEGVFRAALGEMGVRDARTMHPDALLTVFAATTRARQAPRGGEPRRGDRGFAPQATLAADAAGDRNFARRFPNLAAVRSLG